MASGAENDEKGGQSGGFKFMQQVIGNTQTFIDGDVANLYIEKGLSPGDLKELDGLFKELHDKVQAASSEAVKQSAQEKAVELQTELTKGKNVNTERMNSIIDALVEMVPGALSALVSMFASPILGALVGPATKLVLDHLQKK